MRSQRPSLASLVQSHFSLASLVKKTDLIFGPIIITYFATQAPLQRMRCSTTSRLH
jgi:hypothetical protein